MDEILSIGDFSARCDLSPKMLRSYAAAGLLVPAAVDASTGYRYYSARQLPRALLIGLLRRAGIAVADVGAFLDDPDPATLDRWERDIDTEVALRREALAKARAALDQKTATREQPELTAKGSPMTESLLAGFATHRGGRESNQDHVLVADGLFAVADGLGGMQDGEVASRLALEALRAGFDGDRSRPGLVSACEQANRAVWEQSTLDGDEPTMGTTIAAVGVIAGRGAVVAHVGDSRLYRRHDGQLERLTGDHSVTADLVRAGQLSEEEALTHPQRHILTRALGVAPHVEVEASDVPCEPGDRLLLCTDGLFKALPTPRLQAILDSAGETQQVADELVAAAIDAGAEDNVTAVVIDIH